MSSISKDKNSILHSHRHAIVRSIETRVFTLIDRQTCCAQVTRIGKNGIKLLYTRLNDLNIFPLRDFHNDVDRMTAKRLGRWTTRLYLILFLTAISIVIVYTTVRPQTMTKTFDTPSLAFYHHLEQQYENELRCPCSTIATEYMTFVEIEPIFHEVGADGF